MPELTTNKRRILLIYPTFPPGHLVGYAHMVSFYPDRQAVMPPLGLLTFAGCLPSTWEIRLIDENVSQLHNEDIQWAEVVLLSGMHPQRQRLEEILDIANSYGKLTVLGGPSVTICPEYYPQTDILHCGEIGDATDDLCGYIQQSVEKPTSQMVLTTEEKRPLDNQPLPALHLIDVRCYLVLPVQFSVGCPFKCDFCDIPIIYGRQPRVKSPQRVLQEIQVIYDAGFIGALVFVDDNLVANRGALKRMLPELIAWQQNHNYPYPISGEVSVDLAASREIIQDLRDARFTHLFFGVESVDNEVLESVSKGQNTRIPLIEAMQTIQNHGIELLMGIIFGFDGDDETTAGRVVRFVEETRATLVYFNLLAALPKTPLWSRMEREDRLVASAVGDAIRSDEMLTCTATNIRYRLPNEQVEKMLMEAVEAIYSPQAVHERISWNARHVFGKQRRGIPPVTTGSQRRYLIVYTLGTLKRVLWCIGVRSQDRKYFWEFLATLIRLRLTRKIGSILEILLRDAPHAHHLIKWGRETIQAYETRTHA